MYNGLEISCSLQLLPHVSKFISSAFIYIKSVPLRHFQNIYGRFTVRKHPEEGHVKLEVCEQIHNDSVAPSDRL
jgi:hypothetical protein